SAVCGLASLNAKPPAAKGRPSWSGQLGVKRPAGPAEFRQPDGQENERQEQPQTAALPGRSRPTELLGQRLVMPAHDPLAKAVKLEGAQKGEGHPDRARDQPTDNGQIDRGSHDLLLAGAGDGSKKRRNSK